MSVENSYKIKAISIYFRARIYNILAIEQKRKRKLL